MLDFVRGRAVPCPVQMRQRAARGDRLIGAPQRAASRTFA
jgi:hypothetical protein